LRFFAIFFIIWGMFLHAQEGKLNSLLEHYESTQELYHKTEVQSAGHVIVYSRRDLDRMQAYTLKDILKIIPTFTLQTSRLGLSNLVKAGTSPLDNSPIKLYIDDHEYPSDLRQNIIFRYGDMNLYFIDHIEVYQGGTSIAFGNEIGSMVIRLYTKKAQRENATSVQASVDTYNGNSLSILSANQTKYFDYLAFANNSQKKYDTYTNKFGNTLSKDALQQQLHLKFYKDKDWSLDIDINKHKSDPFIGFGQKPISGNLTQFYGLVGFTKYFPYGFKLILSASKEQAKPDGYDNHSIHLNDGSIVNHLNIDLDNISNKIQLEKRTTFGKNNLLLGIQFLNKHTHINKYMADGINKTIPDTPKKMTIAMLYAENSYNFDKNNLVTLSTKLDHYNIDKKDDSNQYSLRFGYIGTYHKKATLKLFAIRRYIAPRFVQTSFAPTYLANPNLDTTKIRSILSELIYKFNKHSILSLNYDREWIKNPIIFSQQQKKYINQYIDTYYKRYYIRYVHQFDYNNKIKLEYFFGNTEQISSPSRGALLELYDTFGKFDFYNQLSYRSAYKFNGINIVDGYDYTSAITYRYNSRLNLKLKGQNLFDNYSKVPFVTQGVSVPGIDRKVIATMEYTF